MEQSETGGQDKIQDKGRRVRRGKDKRVQEGECAGVRGRQGEVEQSGAASERRV